MPKTEWSEAVRKARIELGWSQTQLSLACGLHSNTYSCFETGRKQPSGPVKLAIERALGLQDDGCPEITLSPLERRMIMASRRASKSLRTAALAVLEVHDG